MANEPAETQPHSFGSASEIEPDGVGAKIASNGDDHGLKPATEGFELDAGGGNPTRGRSEGAAPSSCGGAGSNSQAEIEALLTRYKGALDRGRAGGFESLHDFRDAGAALCALKAVAPKGQFGRIADDQFDCSKQWRARLLRLHQKWPDIEAALGWAAASGRELGRRAYSVDGALALLKEWRLAQNPGAQPATCGRANKPTVSSIRGENAALRAELSDAKARIVELEEKLAAVQSVVPATEPQDLGELIRVPGPAPLDLGADAMVPAADGYVGGPTVRTNISMEITAERDKPIAASTEAKAKVKKHGLDKKQSALLEIADEPTPEAQVKKVEQIVKRTAKQKAKGDHVKKGKAAKTVDPKTKPKPHSDEVVLAELRTHTSSELLKAWGEANLKVRREYLRDQLKWEGGKPISEDDDGDED